jgi:nitrate reductase (NAD(P)H)
VNPFITQGENTQLVKMDDGRVLQKLDKPVPVRLMLKEELATDTFVYRFELPQQDRSLGHNTCQYLQFETTINGETHQRYYHPMSKVADTGYVDLLLKVYLRSFQHQQGGLFTQHIDKMREGDTSMRITAVGGDIQYRGNG